MSDTTGTSTKERLANLVLGGGISKDAMSAIEQAIASNPPTGSYGGASNVTVAPMSVNLQSAGADMTGTNVADAAMTAAQNQLPAGGGQIYIPPGTPKLSTAFQPAIGKKLILKGAGRQLSILTGAASFAGSGNRGLIDFVGNGTNVFAGCELRELGFDLTAVTDGAVAAIHQSVAGSLQSALQHLLFDDLFFDLSGGGNHHAGIQMEGLGGSTNQTPSHDLTFKNLYGHNGSGTLLLYLNASGSSALARSVKIDNVHNLIDVNGIGDDRVAIIGNFPAGTTTPAEFRNVDIADIFVEIASGLTSGLVNGVKLDTGRAGYLHDIDIRKVHLVNNSGTGLAAGNRPVLTLLGTQTVGLQNITVDGVYGYQTGQIRLAVLRRNASPYLTIRNVKLERCQEILGVEVYTGAAPAGDEMLVIEGFQVDNAGLAQSGNTPISVLLTGGSAAQGWSGAAIIANGRTANNAIGYSNNKSEAGTAQATAWTNIKLRNCRNDGSTVGSTDFIAGTAEIEGCPGINPIGNEVVAVPASGTPIAAVNYARSYYVTAAAGGATYAIQNGPSVVIPASGMGTVRVPAGKSVTPTYTNAPTQVVEGE